MGGNVEAYYEHKAEQAAEEQRRHDLFVAYGGSRLKGDTLLVLRIGTKRGGHEILVGNRHRVVFHNRTVRADDVVQLLKAIGHDVRFVSAQDA